MPRAIILLICLGLTRTFAPHSLADDAASAAALIAKAEAKYQESETLGFAWRNANLALTEARTAHDAQKYSEAEAAARTSIELSEAAIIQARHEAEAWQTRPPFN